MWRDSGTEFENIFCITAPAPTHSGTAALSQESLMSDDYDDDDDDDGSDT